MKKAAAEQACKEEVVETIHPLKKSYMIVSKRHLDYENIDAFEAVTLSLVLFLAVIAGTIMSLTV